MSETTSPIVKLSDVTPYSRWKTEIEYALKELEKFHKRARRVNKKFIDERNAEYANSKWFNLFYANVQILQSALYAQIPKPVVARKYLDYKDDAGRVAASIIERCITQDLDDPNDFFDGTMRSVVEDRLVAGLGQAWIRLETDTAPIELPEGDTEVSSSIPPAPGMEEAEEADEDVPALEEITDQRVIIDYVFWEDFVWSPCRIWNERRWTGRAVYMTRDELVKRFGVLHGNAVPLTTSKRQDEQGSTPTNNALSTARVFEIWDRSTRKVFWLSLDYDKMLDEKSDPLELVGFEPCPEPLFANNSTSNCTPRPDYYMLQDQYGELDVLNQRISKLIEACKVVGVYDQSAEGVKRIFTEGFDNQLIPVENWAMFAEKNGLKGQIDWLPLEAVVTTIQQLNAAREAIKQQIYELTGIADIVRGASKASETLGAQEIKAKFASIRIKKLQDEVARFASDIMRIKAEIMVRHFTPELLVARSNIDKTDDTDLVHAAIELLKSETGFEWRIQVTADTLAQADYAMEKQDRIEFLSSVSKYLNEAGAMVQAVPESAPILIGMLKWAVAGFRNAKDIEGMLDKALDALEKQPQKDKGPSPEEMTVKAENEKLQADMKMSQEKHQMEMQKLQGSIQASQQQAQTELASKSQEQQLDMQMKQFEMMMGKQARQQELLFTQQYNSMKLAFEEALQKIKLTNAKSND